MELNQNISFITFLEFLWLSNGFFNGSDPQLIVLEVIPISPKLYWLSIFENVILCGQLLEFDLLQTGPKVELLIYFYDTNSSVSYYTRFGKKNDLFRICVLDKIGFQIHDEEDSLIKIMQRCVFVSLSQNLIFIQLMCNIV